MSRIKHYIWSINDIIIEGYDRDTLRPNEKQRLDYTHNTKQVKRQLPPRDAWGNFMSAKTKELSDRLAAGWGQEANAVSQRIASVVTQGIAENKSKRQIAKDIRTLSPDIPKNRAELIATTESTRAFAEGQIDAYEKLGIKQLGSIAEVPEIGMEVVTAMDRRVCPECIALSKVTFPIERARGILPSHPRCRCRWKAIKVKNIKELIKNIFCKTGAGGGIKPDCKATETGGVGGGSGKVKITHQEEKILNDLDTVMLKKMSEHLSTKTDMEAKMGFPIAPPSWTHLDELITYNNSNVGHKTIRSLVEKNVLEKKETGTGTQVRRKGIPLGYYDPPNIISNHLPETSMGVKAIARIQVAEGLIELSLTDLGAVWTPIGTMNEGLEDVAAVATRWSNVPYYSYSPADGYPGYVLAHEIAEKLNGTITEIFEPVEDPNEVEIVY